MKNLTSFLPQDFPWGKTIHYFDTLPSTNTLAKQMAAQGAPEGTVILAGHQSAGRGRMGRSFESPEGMGLYLSVILRPTCKPDRIMHLTCAAGLAACNAVEICAGIRPGIKWANDLVWEKQKLGGILTELGFDSLGNAAWAVVGIGINCAQSPLDFPQELRPIATSLAMITGRKDLREALAAALIVQLEAMRRSLLCPGPTMAQYRRDCVTLGQQVSIHRGEEISYATAESVETDGALTVVYADGHRESVASGEVSIRGMYGYL